MALPKRVENGFKEDKTFDVDHEGGTVGEEEGKKCLGRKEIVRRKRHKDAQCWAPGWLS